MEGKAKPAGVDLHRFVNFFPLGLCASSIVFDLIRLFSENGAWSVASEYVIGAGIIGWVVAAVFGTVDRTANVAVMGMFVASWLLRLRAPADPPAAALILSALAVVLALGTDRVTSKGQAPGSLSGHATLSR
jgi:uncharacterized membrane protein